MNRTTRKKLLVAQGALHRAEIMMAKQVTQECLHPGAISRKFPQFALFALAALRGHKSAESAGMPGMNLSTLLPALTAAIAALAKGKSVFKPVIRSIVMAGAFAGIATLIRKSKQRPASGAADVS
jgi:hypothetical protein